MIKSLPCSSECDKPGRRFDVGRFETGVETDFADENDAASLNEAYRSPVVAYEGEDRTVLRQLQHQRRQQQQQQRQLQLQPPPQNQLQQQPEDTGVVAEVDEFVLCRGCGNPGHRSSDCPTRTCYNCGELGHSARECPDEQRCNKCGQIGHSRVDCSYKKLCFKCGRPGHLARFCPETTPAASAVAAGRRGDVSTSIRNWERFEDSH